MWKVIEKTRGEGEAALEKLQNRRPAGGSEEAKQPVVNDAPVKSRPIKKTKEAPQRGPRASRNAGAGKARGEDSRAIGGDESSDDSDGGGFFEQD
jgi:hypothetical protein